MVSVPPTNQYIAGEWRAAGDRTIPVRNPATGESIAEIPVATDREVSDALAAATAAQTEWAARSGVERARVLREVGSVVEDHVEDVASLITAEQGKPLASARSEVTATVDLAEYVAGWGRRLEGDIVPSDNPDEQINIQRHPYGTVVGIVPWNYPISVFMRKLLPPLIAGNAVVIKPSEVTPLSTLRLVEALDDADVLPEGLLNVVVGDGTTGEALVTGEETDMVSMTGSVPTGKTIRKATAESLVPVSLELGGKAPAIVAPDADVSQAVEDILTARVTNAGQVCTCAERVYVHEDVVEEFTEQYVEATRDLVVGPPEDNPDVGPQVSAAEREKTESAVEHAVEAGANVATGGKRPAGDAFEGGYWYEPTVLTDVDPSMDVVKQEVFGPVTPIVSVESVDDAIAHANDSKYGLSSYVYTSDYRTAHRAAQELEYGETYLNRTLGEAWQGFHTGWKESGISGEDGKYGVQKYTRQKTVYHDFS